MDVKVKKEGKSWGVYADGKLVEGGFFQRDAAERAARQLALLYLRSTEK